MEKTDRNEKSKTLWKDLSILVIILIIAAALRLMGLGTRGVWLDEAYDIGIVNGAGVNSIIESLKNDVSPPLHYIFLSFVTKLFGSDEFCLRFTSVIFGLLLIFVIYKVMCQAFPETQSAYISALLVTISPIALFYSQEIRPYSLLVILAVISFFSLTRGLSTGKTFWWIIYSVSAVLCFFTHYSCGTVLVSYLVIAVFTSPSRTRLLQFFSAEIPLVIAFLLWYPEFSIHNHNASFHTGSLVWKIMGLDAVLLSFNTFMGAGPMPSYLLRVPSSPLEGFACAIYVPSLIVAVRDCFSVNVKKEHRTFLLSLLLYCFISFLVIITGAVTGKAVYIPGRTDFIIYPGIAMLTGYGLSRFPQPWRAVAICVLIITSCLSLNRYYCDTSRFKDRVVALNHIPSIAEPHDAVLLTSYVIDSYGYYLARSGHKYHTFEYPPAFMNRSNTTKLSDIDLKNEADLTITTIRDYFSHAPPESGLIVVLRLEDQHVKYLTGKLSEFLTVDPDIPLITVESSTTFHRFLVGRMIPDRSKPSDK